LELRPIAGRSARSSGSVSQRIPASSWSVRQFWSRSVSVASISTLGLPSRPKWPAKRVTGALRAVLAADTALKGTTISDERGILTDLVLRMATSAKAAA